MLLTIFMVDCIHKNVSRPRLHEIYGNVYELPGLMDLSLVVLTVSNILKKIREHQKVKIKLVIDSITSISVYFENDATMIFIRALETLLSMYGEWESIYVMDSSQTTEDIESFSKLVDNVVEL